ncbi:hypothetical protein [Actinacidiphila yeochonensis]|uniref:hypothetical protein n=1 Tax=Actinacidiphila yeochonensis TaxID=89050 RepID=UPI000567C802|nr:hypothetical protein [Actinacidiphila yeochonensis]
MHMASAPLLLDQDRPDFEHVLDEALRIVLDSVGGQGESPLTAEQLRRLALAAAEAVVARAPEEYAAYRTARARSREEAGGEQDRKEAGGEQAREQTEPHGDRAFSHAALGMAERSGSGAGICALLAVLTPFLAGAAAVLLLLIGYAMAAVSPEPGIAAPLRTAGWFFAAVAAAAVLLGAVGLLLTALRDGAAAVQDAPEPLAPEVARARSEWHGALLARALLPFLEDALAEASAVPPAPAPRAGSRMPQLGYTRPRYSSPLEPHPGPPRFSSPDFGGPDFGGPDFGGPDRRPE